jgi:phage portal protein BeeE
MGILARAARKSMIGPDTLQRGAGGIGGRVFRAGSEVPRRNASQLLELYGTSPWVRVAADTIANRFAAARWFLLAPTRGKSRQRALELKGRLLSRDGAERITLAKQLVEDGEYRIVEEHPFLHMVRQGVVGAPWLELPGHEVMALGQITRDFVGEEVLVLERNLAGIPVRWFPVPPSWVRTPTATDPSYYLAVQGARIPIPAEDVAWHRVPSPANPYGRGSGIAQALDHEIEIDEQMAAYLASFLRNRARPDLLIMGPGIGKREREEMEEGWNAKLGGALRQAAVHFLGIPPNVKAADVIVQDLQKTAADLEASKLREAERDVIVQVFGVSPDVIGASQNSNRATATQAAKNMRENVLSPRLEAKRRFFQARFFDQRGDRPAEYLGEDRMVVAFELPELVDEEHRLETMKAAPYVATENEWRAVQGLPPVEGGDTRRFMPLGIQAVDINDDGARDAPAEDDEAAKAVRAAFGLVLAGEGVATAAAAKGLQPAEARALRLMAVAHGFEG